MRERLSLADLCVMCLLCVTGDVAKGMCVDLLTGQRYPTKARWSHPVTPTIWRPNFWPPTQHGDFQHCRQFTCQSSGAVTVASCQTSPIPKGCSLVRSPRARLLASSPFPTCCPVVLCPIGHPGPRPRPTQAQGLPRSYDQDDDYAEDDAVVDEVQEEYPDEGAGVWQSEALNPLAGSPTQEVVHTQSARRTITSPVKDSSPSGGDTDPANRKGTSEEGPLAYESARAVDNGNTPPPTLEHFPRKNNYESGNNKTAPSQIYRSEGAPSSLSADSVSSPLSVDGGAAVDAGEGMTYSKADSTQLEFSSSVTSPERGSGRPAETVVRNVSSSDVSSVHYGLRGRAPDQLQDAQQESVESMGLVQAVMQKAGNARVANQDNSAVMQVPKAKSVT